MPFLDILKLRKLQKERIRIVSLTVTSACNLRCKYCYEEHSLRSKEIMDISLAKEVICYYMEEEGADTVEIDYFGGEPLIAFDLIRDVVDWFHTLTWNRKHVFFISTNGTILNDEMRDWLYKNKNCVQVGFSIDGTKISHDLCRSGSYDLLVKNLPFFRKYWSHQPAKMTVCSDTIPYLADGVIELEEMGMLFTTNMAFENHWGDEENKSTLREMYEHQLSRLVDYYVEHPLLYPVSPILTAIPEYLVIPSFEEMNTKEIKRFCGAGHEMAAIDVDGTRYPCHRFMPWITKKPAPKENVNCQNAWKPESCANCKLIPSCPTCAGYNWEINGDTGHRTTFHCESYKLEVMASCLLEWKRLRRKLKNISSLSDKELVQAKSRLAAIEEFIENPVE